MTQRLHKFTALHEVLERAQRFHESAAALLAEWAAEDTGRAGSFLKVAAKHEREVADSFARALASDMDLASVETFYQNPPETIPGEDDLRALALQRQDMDALAASLHELHVRWVAVYDALEATNAAPRVDELVANCRALVERLERQLSSAQVQLQDL